MPEQNAIAFYQAVSVGTPVILFGSIWNRQTKSTTDGNQRVTFAQIASMVGASMANESGENRTAQEFARTIHDEVQIARDTALKAHQLFVHSDHRAASEFMHHADQLNHVLAGLNRMSEKPTDR
jgi:hypothetical protein